MDSDIFLRPQTKLASGWVYVLTNSAMPGLVKIGCTGDTPEARARKLSEKTGVPTPFKVAWAWPVSNWHAVEQLTHGLLSKYRLNDKREFFCCSVRKARRTIKRAARAYLRPWWWKLFFQRRPLRIRGQRPSPPILGERRRPLRAKRVNRLPLLIGMGMVLCAIAVFKPDTSALPDGAITRTIRMIEGAH